MPSFVTSDAYRVDIGAHVFPTEKYAALRQRLLAEHGAQPVDFIDPPAASAAEVLRVHTPSYFSRCRDNRLKQREIMQLELPWSPQLFEASVRSVRGTIISGDLATQHGIGLHLGGGFHHAFADHGEGFCVFNDIACGIRALQHDGVIERALVVDCDLHQGNGTAAIFAADPSVATFSIHQRDIYPAIKPPSTVDVDLEPGTDDATYLAALRHHVPPLFASHEPDLVVYVAGADPYVGDQLGSLALSKRGLQGRDRFLVDLCQRQAIPMALVLAGGYAHRFEDTVDIHLTTVLEASRLWSP